MKEIKTLKISAICEKCGKYDQIITKVMSDDKPRDCKCAASKLVVWVVEENE